MSPRRADDERSGDASARVFVAIALDAAARRVVERVIGALRTDAGGVAVRWVAPENLHVTLCFLGNVALVRLGNLVEELSRVATALSPFSMQLGTVALFPSAQRPRVVTCEVAPVPRISHLAEAVGRAVTRAGVSLEARPFRPHLTLGRVREGKREPVTASVTSVDHSFGVNEIVLFRSELRRTGALHTPLERIALGGSDHP
jgi:2'-5' RNA ligase